MIRQPLLEVQMAGKRDRRGASSSAQVHSVRCMRGRAHSWHEGQKHQAKCRQKAEAAYMAHEPNKTGSGTETGLRLGCW